MTISYHIGTSRGRRKGEPPPRFPARHGEAENEENCAFQVRMGGAGTHWCYLCPGGCKRRRPSMTGELASVGPLADTRLEARFPAPAGDHKTPLCRGNPAGSSCIREKRVLGFPRAAGTARPATSDRAVADEPTAVPTILLVGFWLRPRCAAPAR